MSKAYYFAKNFSFKEISNLLCYSTKTPEILTSTQKITRLYRANLRLLSQQKFLSLRQDFSVYNELVNSTYSDFEKMTKLSADSAELKSSLKKYEKVIEENYDPSMVIDESRPYAPAQSRYLVWPNEALSFDPFGYYKPKLASDYHPQANFIFAEDYPEVDSNFVYDEIFGNEEQLLKKLESKEKKEN